MVSFTRAAGLLGRGTMDAESPADGWEEGTSFCQCTYAIQKLARWMSSVIETHLTVIF